MQHFFLYTPAPLCLVFRFAFLPRFDCDLRHKAAILTSNFYDLDCDFVLKITGGRFARDFNVIYRQYRIDMHNNTVMRLAQDALFS